MRGEREELVEFRCRERNLSLSMISTIKIVDFCVNEFHFMRGV
jgi:hypothetical protein